MEKQAPGLPPPLPEIAKKKLWLIVGLPPVATSVLAELLEGSLRGYTGAPTALILSILVFVGVLVCTTTFSLVVGKRYRGVSQAFLVLSYLLGQIIVCFSLWIGILFFNLMVV